MDSRVNLWLFDNPEERFPCVGEGNGLIRLSAHVSGEQATQHQAWRMKSWGMRQSQSMRQQHRTEDPG